MSKAFTKEDDDSGFQAPLAAASAAVPQKPFYLTHTGAVALARHADPRVRAALEHAEVLARVEEKPERAALGVTVVVHDEEGAEKRYRLVSAEEHALLGEGCSVHSPLGAALLGASVGDVRELRVPRGNHELEIVTLMGETE